MFTTYIYVHVYSEQHTHNGTSDSPYSCGIPPFINPSPHAFFTMSHGYCRGTHQQPTCMCIIIHICYNHCWKLLNNRVVRLSVR